MQWEVPRSICLASRGRVCPMPRGGPAPAPRGLKLPWPPGHRRARHCGPRHTRTSFVERRPPGDGRCPRAQRRRGRRQNSRTQSAWPSPATTRGVCLLVAVSRVPRSSCASPSLHSGLPCPARRGSHHLRAPSLSVAISVAPPFPTLRPPRLPSWTPLNRVLRAHGQGGQDPT